MPLRLCALAALLALAGAPAGAADPAGPPEPDIRQMNDDYVRAFLTCDVARFRAILADDFTGILADGRIIDKAEFLRLAAARPDAGGLRLHDVVIRVFGETAVVGAFVTYRKADGTGVRTRYTSVFARRADRWMIVWVQWIRVTGS